MGRRSKHARQDREEQQHSETEIWNSGDDTGQGSGGTKGSGSGGTKGSGSGGTKGSGSGGTKGSGTSNASASSTKSYHNGGVEGDSFADWYDANLAEHYGDASDSTGQDGDGSRGSGSGGTKGSGSGGTKGSGSGGTKGSGSGGTKGSGSGGPKGSDGYGGQKHISLEDVYALMTPSDDGGYADSGGSEDPWDDGTESDTYWF